MEKRLTVTILILECCTREIKSVHHVSCVVAEYSHRLWCFQGESDADVLQEYGAGRSQFTNELVVVITNVDIGRAQGELVVVRWEVGVQGRFLAVNGRVLVLPEEKVRCHDTHDHVVDSRLRDRTVVDRRRHVAAEERRVLISAETERA